MPQIPEPARPPTPPDTPDSGLALHRPARFPAQRVARLILAAVLIGLGIWILWDFIAALVWAAVFAIATWPLFERFLRLSSGRHWEMLVAPLIFTLLIGLLFLAPLALLAVEAGREALFVAHWIPTIEQTGLRPPDWVAHLPLLGSYVSNWWLQNLSDPHAATRLLGRMDRSAVVELTRTLGTQLLRRTTVLVFTLLTLFFLYRDGVALLRQLAQFSHRLFGPSGERLGRHMVQAVRGTVNGLVLVGMGEGALLGIAYTLVGLPRPALLGALTGVLAMIPFGAPVIFGAASVLLLAQSSLAPALFLLGFGFFVVFIADHFIRPVLIGGSIRLPFLWVLLGILGGVESFGLLGLFLGPAVMALLVALWREWADSD